MSGSRTCEVFPAKSERVGPAVIMGFSIALIVFSFLLALLVLMHKGKGGGLSDMFGGGMQSSVGGSSVAERNLDRLTVVVGLVWFAIIVVLGLLMKLQS
ncbi:preprotein translocase subunit SecG [Streptomyces sp. WMMB 322]|nr:preprotein translocase subunit SecG [Streptomyces sp. WMMB 322]